MRYRPELDGIRAVAVLAVIGLHVGYVRGGFQGVDVFFVLSGYLITSILLAEHETHGRIALGSFYVRRLLRLYPALLALLVVIVPIAALAADYERRTVTAEGIVSAGTYTKNFAYLADRGVSFFTGHTWSLAVEEQFYLVWPWVILALIRTRRTRDQAARILVGAVVVLCLLYGVITWHWTVVHAQFLPPTDSLELVLGAALAFAPQAARAARTFLAPVVALAGFAVVALALHQDSRADGYWGIEVTAVASLLLVAHAVAGGALTPALAARPLVWIGRRSYGLYLYHYPIYRVFKYHVHSQVAMAVLTVASAFIVSAASYRYVEQPFLRRKHRFERVPRGGRPDA